MSLLLLAAASGGAAGGYAVEYGGDAAELHDPSDLLRGGVTVLPQSVSVAYGGDAATLYMPDSVLTGEPETNELAYGGDASARYPITLFVTVSGDLIPAGSDPENRVRVWHFADAASLGLPAGGTELDESFARGWTQVISEAGSFTVALQNTDADLAAIDYGDYIRMELDGIGAFLGVVESIDRVAIAPGEEHDQITTIGGRGAVAEWDRAPVNPSTPPGSDLFYDTRHYGWMSVELLDQHWPFGLRQWRQDSLEPGFEAKWGTPLGWPDGDAWWIWSSSPTGDGQILPPGVDAPDDPPVHEAGVSYFRNGFTVAADDTELAIYLAADDAFEAWVDGVPIGSNQNLNGWKEPFRADVKLDAGQHVIAVRVENFEREPTTNTAGFICAIYTLDAQGKDAGLLLRTGHADWEVQHLPTRPPGFTVGQVIRLLLEEAQADGFLTRWTLDFDDATDSDGNPWPTSQQFSFPAGVGLFSGALLQLAETHIDFTFDTDSLTLRAWKYGTAGVSAASATADLAAGLGSLSFEGRG